MPAPNQIGVTPLPLPIHRVLLVELKAGSPSVSPVDDVGLEVPFAMLIFTAIGYPCYGIYYAGVASS
jgi:hypothetical protein